MSDVVSSPALEMPPCPVCDSTRAEIYVAGEDELLQRDAIGQSRVHQRPGRVLRCVDCGHGYRALRPDAESLASLYAEQDVETYLAEVPGRSRTAREHWALVKSLMSRGQLLDVGSASGLFLERANRAGWKATGIEPSAALCAHARARVGECVDIVCGTLESADLEAARYDVVTLWDVLEHSPDPKRFLGACAKPLKPGGFLLLNVPHLDSRMARWLGRRWPLLLPEHLHYFSKASLLACVRDAGFTLERFDQRLAFFSVGHVLHRLSEHALPLAGWLAGIGGRMGVAGWIVPVPLGEIVAVLRKPLA
ncbi:MAG: class I SAM-dependent methyltransferase [bacterium]|nr:class I SAM-dependent methyltransferase [bacterium]